MLFSRPGEGHRRLSSFWFASNYPDTRWGSSVAPDSHHGSTFTRPGSGRYQWDERYLPARISRISFA